MRMNAVETASSRSLFIRKVEIPPKRCYWFFIFNIQTWRFVTSMKIWDNSTCIGCYTRTREGWCICFWCGAVSLILGCRYAKTWMWDKTEMHSSHLFSCLNITALKEDWKQRLNCMKHIATYFLKIVVGLFFVICVFQQEGYALSFTSGNIKYETNADGTSVSVIKNQSSSAMVGRRSSRLCGLCNA